MENNNRNQYNQDWDRNRGRFDQENDYNQNNEYDQNRGRKGSYNNGGNYSRASYGNQYSQQNDWNQDQNYNRNAGNYGNEYSSNMGSGGGWGSSREDYDRRWNNTGGNSGNSFNSGSYGNSNMGRGYGSRGRDYSNMNSGHGNRDWWDRTRDEVSSWFGDDDAERRRNADRSTTGAHKGKGPKGYTRSDDRIREDVHDRLSDDPYVDASDIEIKIENGEVVLTGNVSDRDQKRRAEDIAESISGVRNVENRIRVKQEHGQYADANNRRGNYSGYTGNTNDMSGIGNESGTTNEIIRNAGNMNGNR